jgi:uncharacterized membrane protein
VAFSVVLAIGGIGTLIFFIHHIASSIQASSIIASVTKETLEAVDRLFPEKLGREPMDDEADPSLLPLPARNWQPSWPGAMATSRAWMTRRSCAWRGSTRPSCGWNAASASLWSGTPRSPRSLWRTRRTRRSLPTLRAAYSIDRNRTVEQDCAFGIRQLVDMALRALSPGINDTTTAVMCVDYLTAILARLASREIPSSRRYEDGELRVISIGQTFASLVAESFDEIRGSAGGNVAIMLRMLGALQTIASLTDSPAGGGCSGNKWSASPNWPDEPSSPRT